jgi:hypothetical protein
MKDSNVLASEVLTDIETLGTGEDTKHRKLIAKSVVALTLSSNDLKEALRVLINSVNSVGEDIKKSTTQIIESNKKLNESNEKYSNWIKWLTVALVLIGFLQIIVSIYK